MYDDILNEIVARACSEKQPNRYLTIVAIDPYLTGDWLAPEPAGYEAAKRYGLDPPCRFDYAGNGFFGGRDGDRRRARNVRIHKFGICADVRTRKCGKDAGTILARGNGPTKSRTS